MIYIVIILLALMLAGNHFVSRSLLYPPSAFTAVWLITIIGLALSGDTFYPLSAKTLTIFVAGALAFSIGGLIFLAMEIQLYSAGSSRNTARICRVQTITIRKLLDLALLIVLIGLPFYARHVLSDVDITHPNFFALMRASAVEAADTSQRSFSLIDNFVILSQIVALAMHYENDGTRPRIFRAYGGILIALIYGAMTATKGNAVMLLLTLMFMSFMRSGRINYKMLGITILTVLMFFGSALMFVNFAYMSADASSGTYGIVLEAIQNYWLGGLVAFETIVQSPGSIESTQDINRFFLETANGLGAHFVVPNISAAFTNISASQDSNTYTIYFSYFKDYGWLGTGCGLAAIGWVSTWVYRSANRGGPLATIFYGLLSSSIVLSFMAEHFMLSLNFFIKVLIVLVPIYYVIPRLSLFKIPLIQRKSLSA